MNYKDIQAKSDAELVELVQTERAALRDVRFSSAGMGSNDVKKVRSAKAAIARALTELSARRTGTANSK